MLSGFCYFNKSVFQYHSCQISQAKLILFINNTDFNNIFAHFIFLFFLCLVQSQLLGDRTYPGVREGIKTRASKFTATHLWSSQSTQVDRVLRGMQPLDLDTAFIQSRFQKSVLCKMLIKPNATVCKSYNTIIYS